MARSLHFLIVTAVSISSVLGLTGAVSAPAHVRYRLVDIGTFGGPAGYVPFPGNSFPVLSPAGTVIGTAATTTHILAKSDPFVCGGSHGGVPNIFHALEWHARKTIDLGSLSPTDKNCSIANSVNARDEIAGISEIPTIDPIFGFKELRAVLWARDGIVDLGTLGGSLSLATGINDHGRIVGGSLNSTADPVSILDFQIGGSSSGTQTRAFYWEHGTMHDIGTLGGSDAFAEYVNARGQIAGYSYTSDQINPSTGVPTEHPFLWDNGRITDLGTLGGTLAFAGLNDMAGAMNNLGQVVGESTLAGDQVIHPFFWNGHTLIDLYTSTSGGKPETADAISDSGVIIGLGKFPGTHARFDPYILRDGVATDLGNPTGDCHGRAFAMNSHGQIVGNSFRCDFRYSDAFLWENGTIYNLNTLIPKNAPLHLTTAYAINDRGEIAGIAVPQGVDPNQQYTKGVPYLLIPCSERGADCP